VLPRVLFPATKTPSHQNGARADGAPARLPPFRPLSPLRPQGGAPANQQNLPPQSLAYVPLPITVSSPFKFNPGAHLSHSPRSHFPLLYPASPAGSAPKRSRTMATDAAAATATAAESKGCPAMKAEFAKHAEYLNALVRYPLFGSLLLFPGSSCVCGDVFAAGVICAVQRA
jgi:hypothetical protein